MQKTLRGEHQLFATSLSNSYFVGSRQSTQPAGCSQPALDKMTITGTVVQEVYLDKHANNIAICSNCVRVIQLYAG